MEISQNDTDAFSDVLEISCFLLTYKTDIFYSFSFQHLLIEFVDNLRFIGPQWQGLVQLFRVGDFHGSFSWDIRSDPCLR